VSSSDVIYLVRHAKAGERRVWADDDVLRPLSRHGWKQSRTVAERLAGKGVSTIHSSPYVRCVQTVEPLAELVGTEIRIDDRLAEDSPFEPVLDLLAEVDSGAVLCSHGDVIPATIEALVRRGMELQSTVDWRKGTVWVLRRKGDRITKGKVWPPPS
jgi:phosphohistidine phosphatase SixA